MTYKRERVVLCMKWGSLYPADYVNVLFSAAKKYVSGAFRFVCLTDDPSGLSAGIEAFPIPDIGLRPEHYRSGAWPKISVFLSDLYGLRGRALFIDLDTVISANIDMMFDLPGNFVAIDSRPWRYSSGPPRTGTGIFAFDLCAMSWVVERLMADLDGNVERFKLEQDFIHAIVSDMSYWPEEWVISFKYHLRQPLVIDRFRPPKPPPQSAKIVAFHGRPRPSDLLGGYHGNWDVFPHYGSGAVPWMRDYWLEHGGRLPKALR